jgi:hypothetical protein
MKYLQRHMRVGCSIEETIHVEKNFGYFYLEHIILTFLCL